MARIAGVDIPNNKRGEIALTYVYGIGRSRAQNILEACEIDKNVKASEWDDEALSRIRTEVDKIVVEGELRSRVQTDIKRLQDIASYRGIRHRIGLPLRGQHTKNNGRTRRGKKRTIANKKKA